VEDPQRHREGTRDYTKVRNGHLVFSKGQIAATVAVSTRDDKKMEPTEFFWVKFSGHGLQVHKKKVKVSITDNDATTMTPSGSPSTSTTGTPTSGPTT
jgi:hypothetical protein